MPNINSHGPQRAILCTRVSMDERARSGYFLARQIGADLYRATPGARLHTRDGRAAPKRR